ncbi:hypothetical protein AC579_8368 [Pseudocercospora musae]|uniref:Uncharacterized protein n=1 Tax=Pseudocercospora musae TaxID=113226 RepID=A0A139II80_9PEZI|nr:hypothetical protein AC579_8368 [Pseudocercospora musae]KXT14412.1 hypothetical protein AC579_8368 [Pseudocercospora musae]KXT14415.1 hypothetical protein AC579_8368 [Pseudocercospora musae]
MSSQPRRSSDGGNKRRLDDRRGVSDAQPPADKIDISKCSIASSGSEELGKTPSKSVKRNHADGAGVKLDTSSQYANDSIDLGRSQSHAAPDEASIRNSNDKSAASIPTETWRPISQTEGDVIEAKPTKTSSNRGCQPVPKPARTILSDAASNNLAASSGNVASNHSKTSAMQAYVSGAPTKLQQEQIYRMQQKTLLWPQHADNQRQAFQHAMPRRSTQSSMLQPQYSSRTGAQLAPNTRLNPSLMPQIQAAHDQGPGPTNQAPGTGSHEAPRSFSDGVLGRPSAWRPPNAQPHQPSFANIQAKPPESEVPNQQPAVQGSRHIDGVGNVVLEPIQAVEYLLDENHRLVDVNSIYTGRSGEVNRLNNTIADLNYKLADLNSKLAEHSNLIEEKSSLRHSIIERDARIAQLSANLQRSQQELQRYVPLAGQQRYWDAIDMQSQATFEHQAGQSSSRTRASTAAMPTAESQGQWRGANGSRADKTAPGGGEQATPTEKRHVE